MYEVKYADGYKTKMAENASVNNLIAQLDQDGQRLVLFNDMIDHKYDGTKIKEEYTFIHMENGTKSRM